MEPPSSSDYPALYFPWNHDPITGKCDLVPTLFLNDGFIQIDRRHGKSNSEQEESLEICDPFSSKSSSNESLTSIVQCSEEFELVLDQVLQVPISPSAVVDQAKKRDTKPKSEEQKLRRR